MDSFLLQCPGSTFGTEERGHSLAHALLTSRSPRQPKAAASRNGGLSSALPASNHGWPGPKPSPGSEVTALRERASENPICLSLIVFALVIALRFLLQRLGSLICTWVFGEYSFFHPPLCPAPSPAFLENQSSLFALRGCRAECSRIRATQVQVLVLPFYSFTFESFNPQTHIEQQLTPGSAAGAGTQQSSSQRIYLLVS